MDEEYVTNSAWLATRSRADTIDEIADQFECARPGAEAFWADRDMVRTIRERQAG